MTETELVLEVDKPSFTVKLDENMLKIDLKGSVKNEIEEALENKPILRETIGAVLSIFAPLHVHLSHIDSVRMDKTGKVKLVLPLHRDIVIPLKPKEAKKLVDKLEQLIPEAKRKELERAVRQKRVRKIAETEREPSHERIVAPGAVFPVTKPPGMLEEEREAEKEIEEAGKEED